MFKKQVRLGSFGKTPQFWLQYMERHWLLLKLSLATKTNNLDLHISSLQSMCPLLFAVNHQQYAKYLSVYTINLLNLPNEARALLEQNGFSVLRSKTTAGRTPVDLTIEQTINKHAKSNGGIIGFSRSLPAYYRWTVTRHNRAQYVSALLQITDIESKSGEIQKEFCPSTIKKSEIAVQKTISAFKAFINPFEMNTNELVNLSSGQKIPDDITNDVLTAEQKGKSTYDKFVEDRLRNKTTDFNDRLEKMKIKTIASNTKAKIFKTKNKEIKIQRNLLGQLLVLSLEHEVDMKKVLCYPLSPVPWSLSTANGLPLKTNKSTLFHKIENTDCLIRDDITKLPGTVYVVDGNSLLHALVEIPETFGELAQTVFEKLPKALSIHFVTDKYQENYQK